MYLGVHHNSWSRAYNEPDLPRWFLDHRRNQPEPAFAERLLIPLHPPALRLSVAQLDAFSGEYRDSRGRLALTVFRQGDQLYQKDIHGQIVELEAESLSTLFYPNGGSFTRILVERDSQGRVTALTLRDDRHQERWDRIRTASPHN